MPNRPYVVTIEKLHPAYRRGECEVSTRRAGSNHAQVVYSGSRENCENIAAAFVATGEYDGPELPTRCASCGWPNDAAGACTRQGCCDSD